MRSYCTYFDSAYLDRGLALYASMLEHCQPFHLWILALDEETRHRLGRAGLTNATIVPLGEFMTAELAAIRPTRSWREFIWSCTAAWMLHIFDHSGMDSLNYIDADCYFFNNPEPVYEEIGKASIGITPHRFPHRLRHFEVNGLFNVGLVYAVRGDDVMACLREWRDQCMAWCYYRAEGGKYADQKYLDEWPTKWGAHSIQHKGANLAPWNQEQYTYSMGGDGLLVDGQLILWYHFHQRLAPAYPIHPMVHDYLYKPYAQVLGAYAIHDC